MSTDSFSPARSEARTGTAVIGPTSEAMSDNYPAGSGVVRRPASDVDRLVTSLDVRLSRSEKASVAARARGLGVKPSRWARAVIRDALNVGRADVEALHREAAQQPDPERAEAIAQLRGVGVALNQEQRRRNAGFKTLDVVYAKLKSNGQLDEAMSEKLLIAAEALSDERHAELLTESIGKVDAMRAAFGDGTLL